MQKWDLAVDQFTFWDRLKVAKFVLSGQQLTMGPKVTEFELALEKMYCQSNDLRVVATSSGSSANQLIFEIYKQRFPEKFANSLVICPIVTWVSSVSPAIMAGYKVKFCDINLNDFCFNYSRLEQILHENKDKNLIIWPTALIGFCPDFSKLRSLASKYNAELWGDFCENQFSNYHGVPIFNYVKCSSLSFYFSHMTTSIEFGAVFVRGEENYEYAKLIRNHGLTRSLSANSSLRKRIEADNPNIDKQFLFGAMGTNLRPTDMHAIWGLQDIKRASIYKKIRKDIFAYYESKLNLQKYYIPDVRELEENGQETVGFCLPIFRMDDKINLVKQVLNENGIATRPIIGGCLRFQPIFKQYCAEESSHTMPVGDWVHNHGAYVGLHYGLQYSDIDRLINILDSI